MLALRMLRYLDINILRLSLIRRRRIGKFSPFRSARLRILSSCFYFIFLHLTVRVVW